MKRRILSLLIVLTFILPCGVFAAGSDETKFSPTSISLYVGEACNLSVKTNLESLDWASSDTDVASLHGTNYKAKTVCANKVGTANITVSNDGTQLASVTVTVSEKPALDTKTATFTAGTAIDINKNVFGEHVSNVFAYNDAQKFVEENIKFGSIRAVFNPADNETDYTKYAQENLEQLKRNGMSVVVILSRFKKDSTDQLLEQVKAIYETLKDYQSEVYIELSNELYSDTNYTVTQYKEKVTELSYKIKTYKADGDKKILTAVPIYGIRKDTGQGMEGWDQGIEELKDCYDAVVLHPYTTIGTYDGYTQNTTMHRMFSSSENMYDCVNYAEERYTGKQIWLTEYGILDKALLAAPANTGERGRLQNCKTVGAALCNIDKSLNFLSDSRVNFAHYHTPNDGQMFGIVQGLTILPNYYAFEKVSNILDSCTHVSRLTSEDVHKFNFVGNNITKLTAVEAVSGYAFYDAKGLKYIVFINRDENPCTVSLDETPFTHVWEYTDTTPLGDDYLKRTVTYLDAPTNVPKPTDLSETVKGTSATIKGYSMNVMAVERGIPEGVTVSSTMDKKTLVPLDSNVDLTFSEDVSISAVDVSVKANNVKVPFSIKGSGKNYIVSFEKEAETEYTVSIADKSVTFKTAYKTDTKTFKTKDQTVDLGSKSKNFTCDITFGNTYLTQGSSASLTFIDNTQPKGDVTLTLNFSNNSGVQGIQWKMYSPAEPDGKPNIGPDTFVGNVKYSKLTLTMYDYVLTLYGRRDDGTYEHLKSLDLKGYRSNHISDIEFGCVQAKIGGTSHMTVNYGAGISDGEIRISSADTDGNVCVNTSHIKNDGVIICTAYDTETSEMIKAESKQLNAADDLVEFALGQLGTTKPKYMVFVWDSLENVMPLTESCIYAIN